MPAVATVEGGPSNRGAVSADYGFVPDASLMSDEAKLVGMRLIMRVLQFERAHSIYAKFSVCAVPADLPVISVNVKGNRLAPACERMLRTKEGTGQRRRGAPSYAFGTDEKENDDDARTPHCTKRNVAADLDIELSTSLRSEQNAAPGASCLCERLLEHFLGPGCSKALGAASREKTQQLLPLIKGCGVPSSTSQGHLMTFQLGIVGTSATVGFISREVSISGIAAAVFLQIRQES